ncbi:MAG: glycosyltransferase family 2 protein [Erysipelotrichaceae bacterium]|nr:glycosyltransferase family 2 protein [Erysipelotrichaceae bacterium]MDD3923986.1 glycosyltransferase family 2 protein [Erysipelotrichaceae bacterium]MDD4643015.1 glycosyltransferase family 2 protein [Erysipelotrichaceae bacterium]
MEKISIVVPCYNEQEALPYFYEAINDVAKQMNDVDFEFLFINDGSKDQTLAVIKKLYKQDKRIRFISFSRNFGKEAAMYAGLQNAKGDYVAVMDADLQDPPSLLVTMYETLKNEDYDCVATKRTTRKGEPVIRSFFARLFYRIINKISKADIVDGARDYRLMNRKMVDGILAMSEYNRFSKGIFGWVGYNTKWLSYENIERVAGQTKWSFFKLMIYSFEGIIAFSTAPLAIASLFGVLFCLIAFVGILIVFIRHFIGVESAFGWASTISIVLFVSGIQLFSIGVLGQYLAKTYLETKKRPIYLVRESDEDIND